MKDCPNACKAERKYKYRYTFWNPSMYHWLTKEKKNTTEHCKFQFSLTVEDHCKRNNYGSHQKCLHGGTNPVLQISSGKRGGEGATGRAPVSYCSKCTQNNCPWCDNCTKIDNMTR